ncbi:MAG: preprotein translocase subunit YajC [bacterium]
MIMNLCLAGLLTMAAPPGGQGGNSQSGLISTLVPLLVIFAIFYFLMIRPQQRQQKKHREMLSALKKGDRVLTRGGILGTVHAVADTVITLEVTDNVRIRFSRDAISGVEANT